MTLLFSLLLICALTTCGNKAIDENEQYGTTEYVANLIQKTVGGDIHRIETVIPYTADFDELDSTETITFSIKQ